MGGKHKKPGAKFAAKRHLDKPFHISCLISGAARIRRFWTCRRTIDLSLTALVSPVVNPLAYVIPIEASPRPRAYGPR